MAKISDSPSLNTQRNWLRVMSIMVAWSLVGVIITVYDYFTLQSLASAGISPDYSFTSSLLVNVGVGLTSAFFGGCYLVFVINERYRQSPYWVSESLVALSFAVIASALVVGVSVIMALQQTNGAWDTAVVKSYLSDWGHAKNVMIWFFVLIITQITLQVNDKFGQGVLVNLIFGKYQRPREEKRVFMFIDLISSTTIAETIGNEKYHLLLREFYADITDAILRNKGEIYQYVGDEIVISWPVRDGRPRHDCLHCYFDIRKTIVALGGKYMRRFGVVPDFKAGLHYGTVMAGEIGIIKREITFSGDVLNTASRIQGKCNELQVKILTSDDLLNELPANLPFTRIPLGDIELRGKEHRVAISTIEYRTAG